MTPELPPPPPSLPQVQLLIDMWTMRVLDNAFDPTADGQRGPGSGSEPDSGAATGRT